MSEVVTIPTLGFARGAVVRRNGEPPNMLVVRGLGETTAVIVCEGDEGGTLRLREYPTAELELALGHDEDPARQRADELERIFDLQWAADQRAIKLWQDANPGNENVWPDRTDMVVWLLGRRA